MDDNESLKIVLVIILFVLVSILFIVCALRYYSIRIPEHRPVYSASFSHEGIDQNYSTFDIPFYVWDGKSFVRVFGDSIVGRSTIN